MKPRAAFLAVLLLPVCFGCQRPATSRPSAKAGPPTVPAKILTIRTIALPEKKAFVHKVVIAERKVRIGNEIDKWRLFDLQNKTVTFVDDIARTYRTVPFDQLVQQRLSELRGGPPIRARAAVLTRTGAARDFGGVSARQYVIELGTWRREIWLSDQPIAGQSFFPMLVASEPLGAPYASILESVQRELVTLHGFPVLDRSDLQVGDEKWIIEKKLIRIDRRRVPASLIKIPAGYADLNAPKTAGSPSDRPTSSSDRPNRTTPAGE